MLNTVVNFSLRRPTVRGVFHSQQASTGAAPRRTAELSPVLTAPVSAIPALFATVRERPGPFRPVKIAAGAPEGGGVR